MCQCKPRELRRLATVSPPDICARLVHLAEAISLQGGDIFRNNDFVKTAKERQKAAVMKYGPKVRPGALASLGRGQTKGGRRRSGYLIGILPSSHRGPCRTLRRPPKFTRKVARGSLGVEMMDRAALFRGFPANLLDPFPGMAGLEARESLISEKFSARRLLSTQVAIERGESANAFWLRGPENPTDGYTKKRDDLALLLNLLAAGCFFAP